MARKIEIRTALDKGIYASSGGGRTLTHYIFTAGPRNLLKALKLLAVHKRDMTAGYGNIGHSGSWIEIDGIRLDASQVESEISYAAEPHSYYSNRPETPTEIARAVLANPHSYSAEAALAADAAYWAEEAAQS